MNPNRVEAIYAAVVARPVEQRAAYLAEACGGDAELRQRVEALLQAHDAGSFLDKSADAAPVTIDAPAGQWIDRDAVNAPSEGPGTRIGPYKLLQQIGEGGMGVVWMAEQQSPLRRMVALKIIKPGMDSAAVVARFEAERQALALMDHHNIARIFDGGVTDSGRPFFVMELVKGIPITRFCDENRLTPRERLELFVHVCQAVQHAHQKGVIHRDLKPSNVLVTLYDGQPVPKVIDFGVAKALHQKLTERTMFTAFGTVIGTLEYMSPEQAEMNALDVDTRGDVYSLGVLLYELLTGTTPLKRERLRAAAYTEVLRLIREEEPPRPSTLISSSNEAVVRISAQGKMEPAQLTKLLRGELDWIVMKALEKERSRRYETALGLARDVERYLHDEAVEACPPSLGYRLGKFARKYRVILSTAAAFAALLLLASGVSIWLALAAKRAESIANEKREEAEAAQREANGQRDRAEKEWQRAEDAKQTAEESAKRAKASAAETGRALDRMSVTKGIQLAEEGNLFAALPWFVKPLERGGLTPEEEQVHRTRIACYLRHLPDRPILRQIIFHDGWVSHMAWSADVKRVLTVRDNLVRVWDVGSGECITALRHPVRVAAAQFTPDGARVLTSSEMTVYRWDARTGQQLGPPLTNWGAVLQHPLSMLPRTPWQFLGSLGSRYLTDGEWRDSPGSAEISRDGRRVLFEYKRQLRLMDLGSGKLIQQWLRGTDATYWDRALRPGGQQLLLIRDGRAAVHEAATEKAESRALDHGSPVATANFSPDGSRAITIGKNGTMQVWNAETWKPLVRLSAADSAMRRIANFSSDNRLVAAWGYYFEDVRLAVWDAESGRLIRTIDDPEHDYHGCDWRPGSPQLVQSSWKRGKALLRDASSSELPVVAHLSGANAIYSPDGRSLLTASQDGEVRLWDLGHGNAPFALKQPGKDGFRTSIQFCWVRGLSKSWSSLDVAEMIGPVNPRTGVEAAAWRRGWEKIQNLLPPGTPFQFGALSPDQSRMLVQPHDSQGPSLQLWDARSGRRVGKLLRRASTFNCAAFSADSRFVAVGSEDGTVLLVDARTGQPMGSPLRHGKWVLYAAFSPDSELLVSCGDNTARLWRTLTGQPLGEPLRHDDRVAFAAFSADGRTIATAAMDGAIHLWDDRGASLGVLKCKNGRARSLLFHPSGLLLAAFPDDRLQLWDVALQQEVSPRMAGLYNLMGVSQQGFGGNLYTIGTILNPGFDLPGEDRPAGELIKLSQLYSGRRLDAHGVSLALSKEERQALWRELHAKYPEEFAVSSQKEVDGKR